MSKVVAIMSMSLDGYVADVNDGVTEVFDWYFTSRDVEFHTGGSDPMTFKVSGPSAKHLRGLWSELGAVLTGRIAGVGVTHMRYPVRRAQSYRTFLGRWKRLARCARQPQL